MRQQQRCTTPRTRWLTYSDSRSKVNILNNQFASVFSVEDQTKSIPTLGDSPHPESDMGNIIIHEAGVRKLLHNLKVHKAAGPDKIPAKFLKETATELSPALTLLFQASISQSQIPEDWKWAFVAPIYKKGDRAKASNYRPVSLTCISCKVLEHIVHSSVMRHFDRIGILTDSQHGFRKRRSCETALILTAHDLAKGLEEKSQIDVILLDFSKAFDKVPHERMIRKLDYYGVRGTTQRWIASFLHYRQQKVVLDGEFSTAADVSSGVPQGTVLGPLLFLIFINDLPDRVKSSVRLFADDCIVYRHIRCQTDALALQQDLDRLQDWESTWLMEFHPEKCQLVRVTNKRKPILAEYNIHGKTLANARTAKYLGVEIDNQLKWSTHISKTALKANRTRAFIQRNLSACPRDIKARCYTTLVRPILEYASVVWDPHTQVSINKLEMVQRRAARFVHRDYSRYSSVQPMLTNLGWETLQERRSKAKATMMYRIVNNLIDIPGDPYLIPTQSTTRGHNQKFHNPYCRSTPMLHSFPSGIRIWNALPTGVAQAPCLETFKSGLQQRTLC